MQPLLYLPIVACLFFPVAVRAEKPADSSVKANTAPSEPAPRFSAASSPADPAVLSWYGVLEVYTAQMEDAGALLEGGQSSGDWYGAVRKLEGAGKAVLARILAQTVRPGMLARQRFADWVPLPVSFGKKDGKWVADHVDPVFFGDGVDWELDEAGADLRVLAEHPHLVGIRARGHGVDRGALEYQRGGLVLQSGGIRLQPGQPRLIGVHGPDAGRRVEMVFVTLHAELGAERDHGASVVGDAGGGGGGPAAGTVAGQPLLNKTYALGKSVLEEWVRRAGVDADAGRGGGDVKEVLMALGIPFEAGAACSYDPRSGTLVVRNTADHHGLLAQLLSEPPPDGPGLVRLDYSIYSMQPADARAALASGGESGGVWKRVKQRAAENGAVLERSASLLARSGMVQKLQQVGGRAWTGGGGAVEVVGGHSGGRELPAEGFQLDVEPVARRDGALWDVSARMSLREGKGLMPLGDGLPAVAWEDVRELAGSQTVRVGVHSFVGMFNPPDQTGVGPDPGPRKAWMVFVVAAPEKR